MRPYICAILAAVFAVIRFAESVPPAIFTDPPADATHPAKMTGVPNCEPEIRLM